MLVEVIRYQSIRFLGGSSSSYRNTRSSIGSPHPVKDAMLTLIYQVLRCRQQLSILIRKLRSRGALRPGRDTSLSLTVRFFSSFSIHGFDSNYYLDKYCMEEQDGRDSLPICAGAYVHGEFPYTGKQKCMTKCGYCRNPVTTSVLVSVHIVPNTRRLSSMLPRLL